MRWRHLIARHKMERSHKLFWGVWKNAELRQRILLLRYTADMAAHKKICSQIRSLAPNPRRTHLHGKWDYSGWHEGWSAYHNLDRACVGWQANSTMDRDPEPVGRSIRRKAWRDRRRDSGEDRVVPSTSPGGWGARAAKKGWGSGTANTGRGWGARSGHSSWSVKFYGKWRYVAYHGPYEAHLCSSTEAREAYLVTWHADNRKREAWMEQAAKRRGVAFTPASHTWLWPGHSRTWHWPAHSWAES